MYFPYFRGKQYELICIRENATRMAEAGFVPIIEPVKERLASLERALEMVEQAGGRAILIVNPYYGDHASSGRSLHEYARRLANRPRMTLGLLLTERSGTREIVDLARQFTGRSIALIHAGLPSPADLADRLRERDVVVAANIFLEAHCGKLYRRQFAAGERVLIRDGFKRRKNRDYPLIESFSDLHITFPEEGVNGFGDFLVVGDEYFDTGGPAYAVAIHLTFIDRTRQSEMFIYHFVSDRSSTPTDPAGKFAEALEKLVIEVQKPVTPLLRTSAVEEFLDLHRRQHFPGLGFVKKLSMNHHVETLAAFGLQLDNR